MRKIMNELLKMSSIRPYGFNVQQASEKGLANNNKLTLDYYKLSFLYHSYLEQYFLNILPLQSYDDKITNNKVNIKPVPTKKDFYQKYSATTLNFLILRNHAYIERLSVGELELLKSGLDFEGYSIPILNLVKKTYKDIIKVSYENTDNSNAYFVSYEGETPDLAALNSSVVFECCYSLQSSSKTDNEWKEETLMRMKWLDNLLSSFQKESEVILENLVTVFKIMQ